MAFRLSRRTMLRGVGGIAVGLPVLDAMLDTHGEAYAAGGGGAPCRYAVVFDGQSLGGDGWAQDANRVAGMTYDEEGHFFAPAQTGAGFAATTPLMPLESLRSDYSVVSGMRIPWNANSTDGNSVPAGGAFRDFHGGAASPLLSGVRSTSAGFRAQGITSDQVIANMHAGQTTFDSLVLRVQPSWYLSGSSYSNRQYISYRGADDPIDAQTSPQIAYMSLFANFTPDNADDIARLDFTLRSRRSVLDLVSAKREELVGKVGAADKIRLERHYDELRALENRISAIDPGGNCVVPTDPGTDPAIGGDNSGSGSGDIGTGTGYSDEQTRARVMADLIHMAFVCDLTRVATMQITVFQSHMNVFQPTSDMGMPIRADQHEVGHNGDQDNRGQIVVSTVIQWHVAHYAYLLEKLKSTPEGAGTVLDNSVIVFMTEGGHGTQLNDGSSPNASHSVENMCMLVGGHGGGTLNAGQHIDTGGAHPANCLITAMQAAGSVGDTLGEVSGNIPELLI